MFDTSIRRELPYIANSQALKHITHNEALKALDLLLDACATGWATPAPPAEPAEGECHLVGDGGTGVFAGHDGDLACFADGAWTFFPPVTGMRVWDAANGRLMVFHGGEWQDAVGLGAGAVLALLGSEGAAAVGVNGAADATNRLTVKSDAALFSHDDVTPGSGDMRIIVNKEAVGETATLLFQTGYSGRAEFGLTGSDAFAVKVSPDGATWHGSFHADPATGDLALDSDLQANGNRIRNAGALTVGGSAQIHPTTLYGNTIIKDGNFYVQRDTWAGLDFSVGSDSAHPGVVLRRKRGSMAAPAAVGAGDTLGALNMTGHDGGSDRTVLYLTGIAASDFDVSIDAYWRMAVSDGGTYREVQRWNANGNVGIGTPTPATKLDIAGPMRPKSYTVASLPDASGIEGALIFVTDEAGGAAPAFSDGTDWRRITDRAVVS